MLKDEQLLLEHIEELKQNKAALEEKLKQNKRPLVSNESVKHLIGFWTKLFISLGVIGVIGAVGFGIKSCNNPTGSFYVEHSRVSSQSQPQPPLIDCYKVVHELTFGQDEEVTSCFNSSDEAYQTALKWAKEYKSLKEAGSHE